MKKNIKIHLRNLLIYYTANTFDLLTIINDFIFSHQQWWSSSLLLKLPFWSLISYHHTILFFTCTYYTQHIHRQCTVVYIQVITITCIMVYYSNNHRDILWYPALKKRFSARWGKAADRGSIWYYYVCNQNYLFLLFLFLIWFLVFFFS